MWRRGAGAQGALPHLTSSCLHTTPLHPALPHPTPAHYDGTTRNAAGAVVQFVYGDDGMDPVVMEAGDGSPLDLARTLNKVRWGGRGTGAHQSALRPRRAPSNILPCPPCDPAPAPAPLCLDQVRARTNQVDGDRAVPLPAELRAAVEAALVADPALRVAPQEELAPAYLDRKGNLLSAEQLAAAARFGAGVRPVGGAAAAGAGGGSGCQPSACSGSASSHGGERPFNTPPPCPAPRRRPSCRTSSWGRRWSARRAPTPTAGTARSSNAACASSCGTWCGRGARGWDGE
jgi:hypothetical protein